MIKRGVVLLILFVLITIPTVLASEVFYLHPDYLGSPIGLTDSSGDTVEEYTYDPYGKQIVTLDGEVDNPIGFTGQRFDDSVGLNHFYFRTYDPELGRFLQRDPSGYTDGVNLYEYVAGNPLSDIDPMGLQVPGPFDDAGKLVIKLNKAVVGKSFDGSDIVKLTFSKGFTDRLLIRALDDARAAARAARPKYLDAGFALILGESRSSASLAILEKYPGKTPRQIRNLEKAKSAIARGELQIMESSKHPFREKLLPDDSLNRKMRGDYIRATDFEEHSLKNPSIKRFAVSGKFISTIWIWKKRSAEIRARTLHHEINHLVNDKSKGIRKTAMDLYNIRKDAELVAEVSSYIAEGFPLDEAISKARFQVGLFDYLGDLQRPPRQTLRELYEKLRAPHRLRRITGQPPI
jgi:RHS repeat-associated protein